ncbi:hypothetical protein BV898_13261 [Hypsibius exemplaris]|uniref:HTH CENPB-type domain-containing protein n=1 Tax=Hypsibius exemplaris TaxID=2072580 RepID=A0A1W0WB84_HYPEX|nr:hypothetical protein BV898_13261 [Hypsibius exemplaris]
MMTTRAVRTADKSRFLVLGTSWKGLSTGLCLEFCVDEETSTGAAMTTRLQQQQQRMQQQQQQQQLQQRQQQEAAMNLSVLEGKNRKSYTLAFKRQVINFYHAHAGNISLAAKMFNVDRKMVRSWVEQEDFLRQSDPEAFQQESHSMPVATASAKVINGQLRDSTTPITGNGGPERKRLDRSFASGSSARYPELEKALTEWWLQQINRGQDIKAKALKSQALRLFNELYPHSSDQDFKASTGWLQRFVTRMETSGSARNTTAQVPPSSVIDQAVNRRYVGPDIPSSSSSASLDHRATLKRQQQQQHPTLRNLPSPKQRPSSGSTTTTNSNNNNDRPSPYLVPIKPKPPLAPATVIQYEMPVVIPKAMPSGPSVLPSGSWTRDSSEVPVIQLDGDSDSGENGGGDVPVPMPVQYVTMPLHERDRMERQNKEANRFFDDCRDFLAFLQRVVV